MIDERANTERSIGYVYWWLFWSPLITVPWMVASVLSLPYYRHQASDWLWAILPAALPHLILLFGLRSKTLYRRRHVEQALVLVGVRLMSTMFLLHSTSPCRHHRTRFRPGLQPARHTSQRPTSGRRRSQGGSRRILNGCLPQRPARTAQTGSSRAGAVGRGRNVLIADLKRDSF